MRQRVKEEYNSNTLKPSALFYEQRVGGLNLNDILNYASGYDYILQVNLALPLFPCSSKH